MAKITRKGLIKKLDKVFSEYIRKRDCNHEGYFNCCTCGQTKPKEQCDAGHFMSRRFMSTRWDEMNVHGQCRNCNRFNKGEQFKYSQFIDEKYGKGFASFLEAQTRNVKKFANFELEVIIQFFKKKIADL